MNKLMRKLSISILAVVFAVVAMGATTFAWFTITNTAKIQQFEIEVTSAEGIELSVVDGVWGSTISGTVIEDLAGVSGAQLTAVTSDDGKTNFYTLVSLLENGTYNATGAAAAGTDYVEFEIKVRSREQTKAIYIDPNATTIASAGVQWQPDTTFTIDGISQITSGTAPFMVYARDSARMSFTGGDAAATTVIYEETAAGTSGMSSDWGKGALNYFAAKNNYAAPQALNPGLSPYTVKEAGAAYNTVIVTTDTLGNEWSQATITVRIWLEGWDAECYNAVFGDTLQIKIGFTTIDPTI